MTNTQSDTAVALRAGTVIENPAGDGFYVLAHDIGRQDTVKAQSFTPYGNVPVPKVGEMVPKFVQAHIAQALSGGRMK